MSQHGLKRVVVTGMSGMSPLGTEWAQVREHLRSGRNAVRIIDNWSSYDGLNTRLGCTVPEFELPAHYNRKTTRSMGRVSIMATLTSEMALRDAGLWDHPIVHSGQMGVSFGSSSGTPDAIGEFGRMITHKSTDGINANTYLKMMPHTAPVNIGVFFGLTGRVITTSSACTSGSQGLGYAFEAIRHGQQVAMLAGGAEELHATQVAVFDTLFATSLNHEHPERTPRPFDRDRDGLVLGEGACTLILEELEHAVARNARIYAEIVGFGTNSDGRHITQPNAETMARAMELALSSAGLTPAEIGYICAHGTATEQGDIAESRATESVFGVNTPISSLKGYMGHTLGACGALEAWMSIEMMCENWFAANANLDSPDERCAPLDYIVGKPRAMETDFVMSNNFAFGGINTSLIFRRWH